MKMKKHGLFLFRRDLRIIDNMALKRACKECEKIYTAFIFTPEQVSSSNSFKSKNAIQFMIESLKDLTKEIKDHGGELILLYGNPEKMTNYLIQRLKIDAVYFNRDYTPYAVKRDGEIMSLCEKMDISCNTENDYYLQEPGTILNGSGDFYRKFTPFYEQVALMEVTALYKSPPTCLAGFSGSFEHELKLSDAFDKFVGIENNKIAVRGGREEGLAKLRKTTTDLKNYTKTRDIMSINTSYLSAYIKFGCVSIREVYYSFKLRYGIHHEFIRQLIWRDFYAHNLFGYPQTLGHMFVNNVDDIKWKTNKQQLDAWKMGKTGFPMVDAGMRQLNETGYMHNRVRMMVATFLTKILMIDWREGERYFAQQLTDYDVASNSGNWQAIVGGGYYSMPWFRVMSPWVQSKEYDKDTIYIKQWIPALDTVSPRDIHKWYKTYKLPEYANIDYNQPIVDYKKQKDIFLQLYKESYS